jgi:hypothetical protein
MLLTLSFDIIIVFFHLNLFFPQDWAKVMNRITSIKVRQAKYLMSILKISLLTGMGIRQFGNVIYNVTRLIRFIYKRSKSLKFYQAQCLPQGYIINFDWILVLFGTGLRNLWEYYS